LLKSQLETVRSQKPFTAAIDLTKGKIASRLYLEEYGIPCWTDFSIGRIREAAKVELPTSGHVVSHNAEELREALKGHDLSHTLVLDDTSFSGSTSLIVEHLLRQAFPDRSIDFTHGFLILNKGQLGLSVGAKQRLLASGSGAIEGMSMETPRDDGWHIFDMVKQHNLQEHLRAVRELLAIVSKDGLKDLATSFLADEGNLKTLFPELLTTEELELRRKLGRFVTSKHLNGDFHVRNPQLLPSIIGQKHLLPPHEWRLSQDETYEILEELGNMAIEGGKINES
jgi:hypothetical protein